MPRLSAHLLPTTTASVVTGGAFVIDTKYRIVTVGSTDFTLIGASANTIGVVFTATGIGDGSGTASVEIDGVKFKGDGFYNYSDGLHTVAHYLLNFLGILEVQGALTDDPVEADWVTLDTRGDAISPLTQDASYNFTGNFVWIRARVTQFTSGTITKIQLNH